MNVRLLELFLDEGGIYIFVNLVNGEEFCAAIEWVAFVAENVEHHVSFAAAEEEGDVVQVLDICAEQRLNVLFGLGAYLLKFVNCQKHPCGLCVKECEQPFECLFIFLGGLCGELQLWCRGEWVERHHWAERA